MINPSPPPNSHPSVHISTSARLHFGFMDLQGGLGRRFGSIGLAIDGIETAFRLTVSTDFAVQGAVSREDHDRSLAHLRRLSQEYGFPPATMIWQQAIPSHAGLGSGTQLAMAIAESYAKLAGQNLAPSQLAERGARSGIGLAVYHQGGWSWMAARNFYPINQGRMRWRIFRRNPKPRRFWRDWISPKNGDLY